MSQPRSSHPVVEATTPGASRRRSNRPGRTLAALLTVLVVLTVGAAACSSKDKSSDASTTTTQATDSSETTETTGSTLPQASAPDITTSLYWVRPAGGPVKTDVPGYTDPEGETTPLLAYGSVTNNGTEAINTPVASAVWKTADGESRVTTVGSLRHSDGSAVETLEPGETVDVWVVVSGDTAAVFGDLTPEFVVAPPG